MNEEQYIYKVKVINNKREIFPGKIFPGIRHILTIDEVTTLEDVKSWYYEHFEKLNGDEFIIINKERK